MASSFVDSVSRAARRFSISVVLMGLAIRVIHGEDVQFERDIQPIFTAHCIGCHGPTKQESNYRLDVRELAFGEADFGEAAMVRGDAQASPILRYVAGDDPDGIIMPPEGDGNRLTEEQVARLRQWIDQGAPWPDELAGVATEISTDHWSFQQPTRPRLPPIQDRWIANPIDAFVLKKLRKDGLEPSPPIGRRGLIRRVYLVMLGLFPTPMEVDRFVLDRSPDAYERLVDQVLSSPRYGERWGRHWLDVVRFAETNGFETNRERPTAYHYRDYVIDALNQDKPYDEFMQEQICGDAFGNDLGTGFLVAGPHDIVKSPDINLTMMQAPG